MAVPHAECGGVGCREWPAWVKFDGVFNTEDAEEEGRGRGVGKQVLHPQKARVRDDD